MLQNCLCPVCSSVDTECLLERYQVPVHQNLMMLTQYQAENCAKGELLLRLCLNCGFVYNSGFDLNLLAYGDQYDNTQSHSTIFERYLDELVEQLVEQQGVRNCTVVEVGCGKGHFLQKLVSYPDANIKGYGFDPSYVGPETSLDGRLIFRRSYYDDSCVDIQADVVVCRHVIEHVPDPLPFLQTIQRAVISNPDARIYFETPCIDWILSNKVVWDFFYEHCSLFSVSSLRTVFELAGFSVNSVHHVFNGQYLWLEATNKTPKTVSTNATNTVHLAKAYKETDQQLQAKLTSLLLELKKQGNVALWGAGAKGATLAHLVDTSKQLIEAVVDINPNKQGKYIPGSGHKIIAPSQLRQYAIEHIILMNPNYREEIQTLLAAEGQYVTLHEWSIT